MHIEELKNYLETDEGKEYLQEQINPILENKEKILTEKKNLQRNFQLLEEERNMIAKELEQIKREQWETKASLQLEEALEPYKVNPLVKNVLKKSILSENHVEIGDSGLLVNQKSLPDFLDSILNTPEGKSLRIAPINSGSGAIGGGTQTTKTLEQMSSKEIISNLGKFKH